MPAGDVTVSAEFEEIPKHSLILNAGAGGEFDASLNPSEGKLTYANIVEGAKFKTIWAAEVTAFPIPTATVAGTKFGGWLKSGDDAANVKTNAELAEIEMDNADVTYNAVYVDKDIIQYSGTATVNSSEITIPVFVLN